MTARSIGPYTVLKEVAWGGMATIHLGHRPIALAPGANAAALPGAPMDGGLVAIKRLHPPLARDARVTQSVLDEARLMRCIDHPNVVKLLDVVAEGEEVALVLEYVHGASLADLGRLAKEQGRAIPAAIAVGLTVGLLRGLHAAHQARDESGRALGIVHRDVSPQNVMVDDTGLVRLLDFGVAKAAHRLQTTRDGTLKGKLCYMAPEQVRGATVTARTDVYAAAVVLWELLTGRRLFAGDNEGAILEQVLLGVVEPPSRWVTDLPPALDDVVLQGTRAKPERRFASAEDMAQALEGAMTPSAREEVAAWVRSIAGELLATRAPRSEEARTGATRSTGLRKRRLVRAWSLGAAASVAIMSAIALAAGRHDGAAEVGAAPRPAAPPSAPPSPAPTPPPTSDEAPTSFEIVDAPRADGPLAAPAPAAAPPASARAAAAKAGCSPPYVRDAQGRKLYKLQCLRR